MEALPDFVWVVNSPRTRRTPIPTLLPRFGMDSRFRGNDGRWASAGMTGRGVRDAKPRTAWSEWEGIDIIACVGSVTTHTNP